MALCLVLETQRQTPGLEDVVGLSSMHDMSLGRSIIPPDREEGDPLVSTCRMDPSMRLTMAHMTRAKKYSGKIGVPQKLLFIKLGSKSCVDQCRLRTERW